jgi:hypothetical protein
MAVFWRVNNNWPQVSNYDGDTAQINFTRIRTELVGTEKDRGGELAERRWKRCPLTGIQQTHPILSDIKWDEVSWL